MNDPEEDCAGNGIETTLNVQVLIKSFRRRFSSAHFPRAVSLVHECLPSVRSSLGYEIKDIDIR